jgi:hypothetical protein
MPELYSAKSAGKELGTGSPNWLYELIERYQVQPDQVMVTAARTTKLYYMSTIHAVMKHHEAEKRRKGHSRSKAAQSYVYRPLPQPGNDA